jgi:hypothetical protein
MASSKNENQRGTSIEQYREECAAIAEAEQRSLGIPPEPKRDEPLRFPECVMTGVAGDFANLYSSYLESPKEFFYMSFLTCQGSLLSTHLTLDSEIPPQPRFYTLLLGESADDRKSTAIQKTVLFFKEYFREDFHLCSGVGSAEGLQQRLKQAENAGLLLYFDELKMFSSKSRIEGSVLLPCTNKLFESNSYESQTKRRGIEIEHAYLSMLAASTIQT